MELGSQGGGEWDWVSQWGGEWNEVSLGEESGIGQSVGRRVGLGQSVSGVFKNYFIISSVSSWGHEGPL